MSRQAPAEKNSVLKRMFPAVIPTKRETFAACIVQTRRGRNKHVRRHFKQGKTCAVKGVRPSVLGQNLVVWWCLPRHVEAKLLSVKACESKCCFLKKRPW